MKRKVLLLIAMLCGSVLSIASEINLQSYEARRPEPYSFGFLIDNSRAWVGWQFTTDGGHSWQKFHPTEDCRQMFQSHFQNPVKPYFVTPLRGWLTGTVGTWQTEDGGFTWNKLFPEDCISVEFTTSGYGLLSTAKRDGYTKVFISKDFGCHWQESSLKAGQYKVNKLESLLAIDQTYLAVMHIELTKGNRSTVFVRSSNGINWELLSSSLNANGSYKLFFINQKEGWIADRFSATIFQTIDGGKSWNQLSTKPPIETLISFFFLDLQKGWLISEPDSTEETGVYRTEDGGESWTALTSEELERFEIIEWKDLMLLKMLLNHKK